MRIFITGGTGFVGRALISRLRGEGHEVVAWVRDVGRARAALGEGVTIVEVSGSGAALSEALSGCEAIVNLAGAPVIGRRWSASYRQELVDSRVALTRRLLGAIGVVTTVESAAAAAVSTSTTSTGGSRRFYNN